MENKICHFETTKVTELIQLYFDVYKTLNEFFVIEDQANSVSTVFSSELSEEKYTMANYFYLHTQGSKKNKALAYIPSLELR